MGDGITFVALPLLATSITDDARAVAALRTAALIPWLALALASGVLVDRVDRRSAMRWVQIIRSILLGIIVILSWNELDTLWPLYLLVFALGAAQTIFESAAQALIPEVVDNDALERAHGLVSSGQNAGLIFVGPPLGGLLFAVNPPLPFGIHACAFLLAAALLWTMRASVNRPRPAGSSAFLTDLRAGLAAVLRRPVIGIIAILVGVVSFCLGMAYGVAVLYATRTLGMSELVFGVFISVGAIGGIVAGLTAANIRNRLGTATTARISICSVPVALIGLGLAPWVGVAMVANVVLDFAAGVWLVVSVAVRQRLVPPELHGRVASIFRMLSLGLQSVGAIVGGYVAYLLGLRAPFLLGGLLALGLASWLAMKLTGPRLASAEPAAGREMPPPSAEPAASSDS